MPIFEPYAVITVPFPYANPITTKRRPALLVSHPDLARRHGLGWVLMITSAANQPWSGDIAIDDLARAGLRAPSVIRPVKIAAIEVARANRIGTASDAVIGLVRRALDETLGFSFGASH